MSEGIKIEMESIRRNNDLHGINMGDRRRRARQSFWRAPAAPLASLEGAAERIGGSGFWLASRQLARGLFLSGARAVQRRWDR